MNLDQIKTAIKNGRTVHWKNAGYTVTTDTLGREYYITAEQGKHSIGLTWTDGVTLNGKEEDFYTSPKTVLPSQIKSIEEAKKLLKEMERNREAFHPDDDAHLIEDEYGNRVFSDEDAAKVNGLIEDITNLPDFDHYHYCLLLATYHNEQLIDDYFDGKILSDDDAEKECVVNLDESTDGRDGKVWELTICKDDEITNTYTYFDREEAESDAYAFVGMHPEYDDAEL